MDGLYWQPCEEFGRGVRVQRPQQQEANRRTHGGLGTALPCRRALAVVHTLPRRRPGRRNARPEKAGRQCPRVGCHLEAGASHRTRSRGLERISGEAIWEEIRRWQRVADVVKAA